MNRFYTITLCLFFYSINIFGIGTRSNTPEIELITSAPQSQIMQRDTEPLSCCQLVAETKQTYQNDINAYGPCFCCDTQIERIPNQQVRDCRKRIFVITCLPCVATAFVCHGMNNCLWCCGN